MVDGHCEHCGSDTGVAQCRWLDQFCEKLRRDGGSEDKIAAFRASGFAPPCVLNEKWHARRAGNSDLRYAIKAWVVALSLLGAMIWFVRFW